MHSPKGIRRRRGVGLLIVALVLPLIVAGAAFGAASGHAAKQADKFVVSVGSIDSGYAPMYIAREKGWFKDQNLDVTIENGGSLATNNLLAGRADIAAASVTYPYSPVNQGQSIKIVYVRNGGGIISTVVGKPSYTSITQCQTMITSPPGALQGVWSTYYKKAFNANYKTFETTNTGAYASLYASGRGDCVVNTVAALASTIADGSGKILVSPTKPATLPKNFPTWMPEGVFLAIPSNVANKRDSFVRFFKAYKKAEAWEKAQSPAAVAALLKGTPEFAAQDITPLTAGVDASQQFLGPNNGVINKNRWPQLLRFLIDSGGFDYMNGTSTKFGYDNMVDNTLVDDALKGTRSFKTTKANNTLQKVAATVFGDKSLWTRLYDRNPAVWKKLKVTKAKSRTVSLKVGTVLRY